jgi:hypothetical protein
MREPNLPEPTSALLAEKQGAILLPPRAVMEAIQVLASETVTGNALSTYDIGHNNFGVTSNNLLDDVPITSVNVGVLAQGCNGVTCLGGIGTTGTTASNGFLTVTVNGYDNTAGALKVAVSYWVVPDNLNEIGNPPVN